MEFITFEESKDRTLGKIGTPRRDRFEEKMDAELEACKIGELVKQNRKSQNLTQKELSEIVGVSETQISRIETGKVFSYNTISRVLKALGAKTARLDLGSLGRVALW